MAEKKEKRKDTKRGFESKFVVNLPETAEHQRDIIFTVY